MLELGPTTPPFVPAQEPRNSSSQNSVRPGRDRPLRPLEIKRRQSAIWSFSRASISSCNSAMDACSTRFRARSSATSSSRSSRSLTRRLSAPAATPTSGFGPSPMRSSSVALVLPTRWCDGQSGLPRTRTYTLRSMPHASGRVLWRASAPELGELLGEGSALVVTGSSSGRTQRHVHRVDAEQVLGVTVRQDRFDAATECTQLVDLHPTGSRSRCGATHTPRSDRRPWRVTSTTRATP